MTSADTAMLQEALRHFNAGALPEAEAICRGLAEKQPFSLDGLHLLALIRKNQADFHGAEELFRRCLQYAPRRTDIHANLGNLFSATGRFEDAETSYSTALRIDTTFRPARLGLARALLRGGKHQCALHEAEQLVAADESDSEAWTVLGTALRELGRDEEAETSFRRALTVNPRSAVSRHNLGALLNKRGRCEEALEELQQAASAGIRGPEISFNLASTLMALNRLDLAEETLLRALAATPRSILVHRLLARLRFMCGADNYVAVLAIAVQKYPDDILLRITHSQVLRGAGYPEAAAETLLAAPEQADSHLKAEFAALHQESGRFDAACDAARSALACDPNNSLFSDLLIDALMSLGAADEAMSLIESARQRAPLSQWYIAMEATAARLLDDSRYTWLYDYERFVGTFELEPPAGWSSIQSFHEDLIAVLCDRHRFRAPPLDQSLRLGTQTPRGLLGDPHPVIKAFIGAIAAPLARYRAGLGFEAAHPFRSRNRGDARLSACWSVRLGHGGYHVNHVHPEGWISSAYYVEVPAEADDAIARSGWIKFGEPRFPVTGVTAGHFVQPKPGRLVLFPSYMWHGTTPVSGNAARMSIAFDALPQSGRPVRPSA